MAAQSGIYEIVNTVNGKRYIGSAKNFTQRFHTHRSDLRRGRHANAKLANAWNKYGETAFEFRPLFTCAVADLIFYEQRAIEGLSPEYNICMTAGSSLGRRRSPETAQKMRFVNTGRKHPPEFGEAIAARKRGKPLSDETKAKIRTAKLGGKASAETRAKMSAMRLNPSGETRAKMSMAHRGNTHLLGHVHTPETRAKMSATHTARNALKRQLSEQSGSDHEP